MADRLNKGDLVLVTGATGFLGSSISDELLKRGFKVRAATRDPNKEQLLQAKFDNEYGPGNFHFVQVDDPSKPGAYAEALTDVDGVVHAATDISFGPDYDKVVSGSVAMTRSILESASQVPSVKSVVITSSRVAVYNAAYGQDASFGLEEWNEGAVKLAQQMEVSNPLKPILVYVASKTKAEQAVWQFVRETKPTFTINTILPDVIIGPPINPAPRTYSTSTLTTQLFQGKRDSNIVAFLSPPSFIVDVRDAAVIHVAALLAPDVAGQRLWASSHRVTINDILGIWRDAFPDHQILPDFDLPPAPKLQIDNSKSTALVRRYAERDYISAKQSIVDNVKHLA